MIGVRRICFTWLILFGQISVMATAQEPDPDDRTISFLVGEALREDPRVWDSNIDISTDDGIVKLTGSVVSLMQKQYAGLVARKIHGVRSVLNQISVVTLSRPDADIAADVGMRIHHNTTGLVRGLKVSVDAGQVKLAGEVVSFGLSAEAELAASSVPGVKSVTNEITIQPVSVRSDAQIAAEIEGSFHRDVYLTGYSIQVKVAGGTVSLDGTVGNAYLKQRAENLVWNTSNVAGVVNSLKTSRLADRGEVRAEKRPTDAELTANIHAQLLHDRRLDAMNIQVTASGGHVTLRGHVPTMAQRQLAETDTQDVAGAVWITNLLSVRTSLRPDSEIISDAGRLMAVDSVVRERQIQVRSVDGVVTLSGSVSSLYVKYRAAQVVARVPGIRVIHNQIEVFLTTALRDRTLQEHIRTRLGGNFETAWVSRRISVTVKDGAVVLAGDVDTFAQRREAGRMAAMTSGVQRVLNHVTVRCVEYLWDEWEEDPGDSTAPQDRMWRNRGDFFERPGIVRG